MFKNRTQPNGENSNKGIDLEAYLSGEKLYGNDFSASEVLEWFSDEKQGYFDLQERSSNTTYLYSALNWQHGFRYVSNRTFNRVLGIGSAYGHELNPILKNAGSIVVLEPADGFQSKEFNGVPVNYVQPQVDGHLPFQDNSFDLITCFGVLHHIPNVSKVLSEIYRCLKPGGIFLTREPTISMGDWRFPRKGLTKRERGIPISIFRKVIKLCGFEVQRETRCMFSLTSRLGKLIGGPAYNSRIIVSLDKLVCALPIWPDVYHAVNSIQKLRPTSVFYVLGKPQN